MTAGKPILKKLLRSALLLAIGASAAWAGKEFTAKPGEAVVPNQLLVKVKAGANWAAVIPAYLPNAQITRVGTPDHYLVKAPNGLAKGVSTALAANNQIEFVEPDHVRTLVLSAPNDPTYANSTSGQWGLFTVQALQAWNLLPNAGYLTSATAGTNRVKVAVLDTGVDCTHPDFMNAGGSSTDAAAGGQLAWSGSQAFIGTTVATPACTWQDDHGHGTHVAGILAAATSNGAGVASLGYRTQVLVYKVLDASGSGSDSTIATAITAAVDAGAGVVSMSVGGAGYSQTMQNAIDYAWRKNVVVVAAAGNSATNALFYPGDANHTIGVSASDISNSLASFSNYGNGVSVAAPGVTILSTIPRYSVTLGCCNYGYLSGTSMATPFVSALAGIIATASPGTSAAAIVQRIEQSAANPSGSAWNQNFGYGIINAYNAAAGLLRVASTGGVTGQITDGGGVPVSGAQVTIAGVTATTDGTGLFWIRPVAAGTYAASVAAPGYATQNQTVTVAAGGDTPFSVTMGAAYGNFTGAITDQGSGVAGAIVQAVFGGSILGTAVTDNAGHYTLWVPAGSGYTVQASRVGVNTSAVASQAVSAGSSATVNLTVSSLNGAIAGVVMNGAGSALSGAQVTISSSAVSQTTVTSGTGAYSAAGLPPGTYSVTASAIGFVSSTQSSVNVSADATAAVNFQLAPAAPAPPSFILTPGAYGGPQSVGISSATGTSIRYTLDGSTPTLTIGTLYTAAIPIVSTTTINAVAYFAGGPASSVATATYTIGGSNWYSNAWGNRKRITIDHAKVAGPLGGFPVLITVVDANLQGKAKSDGSDILFTAGDGLTKLNHELEQYNTATGQLTAWVNVPSLSPASDTVLYVYYGNPTAAAQQNAAAVWDSSYAGVYHLGNGTTLTLADSTASVNNGVNGGVTATAGAVGGAGSFAGSRFITTGSAGMSYTHATPFTFEAWIKPATLSGRQTIWSRLKSGTSYTILELSGNQVRWLIGDGAEFLILSSVTVTAGAWTHVVGVRDVGTLRVYVNGAAAGSVAENTAGDFFTGFGAPYMGALNGSNNFFSGALDEVRVSATNRSAAWIATEYANQSAPASFSVFGAEETSGAALTSVTVTTLPAGLTLTVDGATCTAPCSAQWTPGSTHTIAAATQAGAAGTQFVFSSWSDSGAASHPVTAPASSATYTASFTTQYFLTTSASPAGGGAISPASGWYNGGAIVSVGASVNSGYAFTGFSGAVTGTSTPQTVTMSAPLTVTANFAAAAVAVTVASSPAGLTLTVDGATCTAPCLAQWTPGSAHTIAAATQAGAAGTQYAFSSWSDSGAPSHSVAVPASPATYIATFATQYFLTTSATPPGGGVISPASGWYNSGATVSVGASVNSGYTFTGFSGALAGTTTPQTLTMNGPASVTASFTVASGGTWYNSGWSSRKRITIDHTKVAGDLTGFAVLVSITDANLQSKAKADGSDIVFTAGDAVTKLNHEVERYNSATGELIAWVSVPTLAAAVDTVLYLYYGNPSAAPQQNASAVWDSSYAGVFHLGNGTTLSAGDSTTNGNNGAIAGVAATTGAIGGAGSFAGSRYISTGSAGMSYTHTTPFSFEAWINPVTLSARQTIWSRLKSGTSYTLLELNGNQVRWLIGDGAEFLVFSSATVAPGAWTHIVGVRDVGTLRLYVNGAPAGSAVERTTGDFFTGYPAPYMGALNGSNNVFSGAIDEVRVSSTNRSAAWIATEYANQSVPAAFYAVGAEESPGGATTTLTSSPSGLTLTVDGSSCVTPCSFQWVAGSTHGIAAGNQAGAAGTQYVFGNWSDGGAPSHSVTAPANSSTVTASFTTQYFLTTAAAPSAGGTISPASGWYDAASVVPVSVAVNSGYTFAGFSGALTGATTPQNVTMNAAASVTANFTSVATTTITTSPSGLALTVDGAPCTAPCSFVWAASGSHTIAAASQSGAAGTQYVFATWSDGGAASHTIAAPSTASTWTASFTTQYFLSTAAAPSGAGTISPGSGWYNAGAIAAVSASANAGYAFTGFTGGLSGTTTPQNVTMNAPLSIAANFTVASGGSWYTGWSSRKRVTIDHTKVAGALSGFPVLVTITDVNLQTTAKPDGSDILFTAADAVTKLNHEVEQYNSATGQLTAWVNVPSLSASGDTVLYLYYGNPAAAAQQNAAAVWDSSYAGVYHLGNGTTLSVADSTASANNGVNGGVTATAGAVGGGGSFAGSRFITTASAGMSYTHTTPFTFEAWIKPTTLIGRQTIWSRLKGGTSYTLLELYGNQVRWLIGDGAEFLVLSSVTVTAGAWTHVVGVRDVGTLRVYVNGAAAGSVAENTAGDFFTGYPAAYMGALNGSNNFFSGALDEVRVSATNRSAAWIATEYANQSAPGNFYALGAEETPGVTPTTTITSGTAGRTLTVDGVVCAAPCSFQWTPGSSHTVAAATQPGTTGRQYVFASWSDGGAASHSVVAPSSSTTLTVNFTTQYFLTTVSSPADGGAISPSGWYIAGSPAPVTATASGSYRFSGFGGALSGVTATQNVQMNAPATVTANFSTTVLSGCPVLPANNVWNTPIDQLPVDTNSAAYVNTIGASAFLHPDFSSGGGGIPYVVVPGTQPNVPIHLGAGLTESDPGPYPIPANAVVEGGSDAHVIVIENATCRLYETYASAVQPDGSWNAESGATFDLNSNQLRPETWTSADAAGLPIFPGLIRYDEVASGEIRHAIRMTAPQTRRAYVWPARHYASSLTGAQYPPMGQRFRLSASFDITPYPADVQVILRALKKYGAILADNGSSWFLTGAPDPRWNDDTLHQLTTIVGANLEAIDESSLMVDPNSGAVASSVTSASR